METLEEIKAGLCNGDWQKIASLSGMSYDNARKTFGRPTAKRHKSVKAVAKKVAESNRQLGL